MQLVITTFLFQVTVKNLNGPKKKKKKPDMSDKRKHKLLKYVDIESRRMYMKTIKHNTILAWRISDYEELSRNVMYFQLYESQDINCVFRLFKRKEALHLSLTSANIFKNMPAEFSILDDTNYKSITEQAEQIKDGIFVGKFLNKQFLHKDSNFLSNGTLTITFKYVSDYCLIYNYTDLETGQYLYHWDDLSYDLKSMYLDGLFPDFFLYVKEYTFKTHRLILAARSKFFCDLLKSDPEIKGHRLSDDSVPGIVHQVLLYMYSGELIEMNEDCMMEVYKLACLLEVSALCRKCIEYFRKVINSDNYMKFCEFSAKFNLKEMKNMIIHTAKEQCPSLNILDIFKQIARRQ